MVSVVKMLVVIKYSVVVVLNGFTSGIEHSMSRVIHLLFLGNSNCFQVKVSMHQDSALISLLFVIVMEALS